MSAPARDHHAALAPAPVVGGTAAGPSGGRRPGRLPVEYVLPLRRSDDSGLTGLTDHLRHLARWVDVTVVDGSPPELFARHAAAWRGLVRHVRPDAALGGAQGRALGVLTGVGLARHEHVVIADDDVRYDESGLRAVHELLDRVDLVRPQGHFDRLPWHAWWDTGRTLLNRAFGGDWPGTVAVRRGTFRAMGGYDPDVLFEDLELARTVRAYGGATATPAWLHVRRLPPTAAHFRGQRIRQAYRDQAQPLRLLAALAVLPGVVAALAARRPGLLLRAAVATVAVAEVGRRRAGGARVFPAHTALAAPLWVLERGVCSWLALGRRWRGGVPCADVRVREAAHSVRTLRRRLAANGPGDLVLWVEAAGRPRGAVADRTAGATGSAPS
ncbi:glycosyltransferase family 2 protein [Micromonospora sp. 4G57]|uniref:Glycosyltransferase family 2 protein n=1 Tax=Micromonospora sicca TaxID=2202420 RepID=A0ABU5JP60_9ACTN|nr:MULTISPECIES: glycosyltransferase family 2 protein [unclassified Micromonospora]MDZ5443756.1 glycosyltransferase family 2 protein [Micromonospora sp. 4G57]MDZ5494312.1 glycosyltransferase family 2 protein [Micromonospora sp. 4G53]